jgi:hypothetical protein
MAIPPCFFEARRILYFECFKTVDSIQNTPNTPVDFIETDSVKWGYITRTATCKVSQRNSNAN